MGPSNHKSATKCTSEFYTLGGQRPGCSRSHSDLQACAWTRECTYLRALPAHGNFDAARQFMHIPLERGPTARRLPYPFGQSASSRRPRHEAKRSEPEYSCIYLSICALRAPARGTCVWFPHDQNPITRNKKARHAHSPLRRAPRARR